MPLWTSDLEHASQIIFEAVPSWKGAKVALSAKYLGMQLGPDVADKVWKDAIEKYVNRVQIARSTGAGLLCSVLEYNIKCLPALSYTGQFCETGNAILATEARMLQRLAGCPRHTFTKEAMWSLDAIGLSHSFKSIRVCNTAAMVRMALETATVHTKMKQLLDETLNNDDVMLAALITTDAGIFDMPAIVNTLQKAIDIAFLPDIQHNAWTSFINTMGKRPQEIALQKAVADFLHKASNKFDAPEFITQRMERWRQIVGNDCRSWWAFQGHSSSTYAVLRCTGPRNVFWLHILRQF